jgi:hypothetical protein
MAIEKTSQSVRKMRTTNNGSLHIFHKVAVFTVLGGSAGSLGFAVQTGRYNESLVLLLLFAGWVVTPFIALLLVNAVAGRWSSLKRLILYSVMMLITVASLILYSGLWTPTGAKPAFVFVMVPLLSWFVMGIAFLASTFRPSR